MSVRITTAMQPIMPIVHIWTVLQSNFIYRAIAEAVPTMI